VSGARLRLGLNVIDDKSWMGGVLYVRSLVRCLACQPSAQRPRISLLGVADPNSPVVRELSACDCVEAVKAVPGERLGRLWRRLTGATSAPPELVFPAFAAVPPPAVPLYWLPDFQHLHLPELFSAEERQARSTGMAALAAQEGTLVLSSAVAAADFARFFPQARIRSEIWRFCSELVPGTAPVDPRPAYSLPDKYLYLPNQFWAHKNHRSVFLALGLLKRRGIEISLVCTGLQEDRRDVGHFPRLRALLDTEGVADQVRFLGLIPRADQIEVLRHAAAVVQPSLFEGWSTVVEDTLAIGRPLFVSDLPVHREQLAAAAEARFFDPLRADSLADALEQAWPGLTPGPDAASERAAAARLAGRRMASGAEFIRIATSALAHARAGYSRSQ